MSNSALTIRPVALQERQEELRRLRLGGLQGRPRVGAAAQGRSPRPHHSGQESVVRARRGRILARGARRQGRRPHQRAGRRSGAGAYGRRDRPMGHVRSARRRGGGGAHQDRRRVASGEGHDERAWTDQPVDLGRAGPRDRRLCRAADGDDGAPSARVSGLDRGRGLREGEGPRHLRARHHQLGRSEDRPADLHGRTQSRTSGSEWSTSPSSRKRRG